MKEILILPRLGETMEVGRVTLWLKQPGDKFRRGETIVEIESDKTVVELPALEAGWIEEILAAEGTDVAVGNPLCTYRKADDTAGAQLQIKSIVEKIDHKADDATKSFPADVTDLEPSRGCRATPKARAAAKMTGLKLAFIQGTGRRGRIETRDILKASAGIYPELNVRNWGQSGGNRFVLLHGYGGDSKSWSGLATRLSHYGAQITALDLPGHGATTKEVKTIDDLITPVITWLQKQNKKSIDLVGHSLGGFVAAMAAGMAGQAVRTLTLMAPVGLGPEIDRDFIDKMATIQHTGALAHLLRRLAMEPMVFDESQLSQIIKENAGRIEKLSGMIAGPEGQRLDLITRLTTLDLPVRIIWGIEDRILPWVQAGNVPAHVQVHFIRGAGHMVHWDRPDIVSNLLLKQ